MPAYIHFSIINNILQWLTFILIRLILLNLLNMPSINILHHQLSIIYGHSNWYLSVPTQSVLGNKIFEEKRAEAHDYLSVSVSLPLPYSITNEQK